MSEPAWDATSVPIPRRPLDAEERLLFGLVAVALLLYIAARRLGVLTPASTLAGLLPLVVTAILGLAYRRAGTPLSGWSWRERIVAILIGFGGGLVVLAWESLLPGPLRTTDILALVYHVVALLPALVPAAALRRPGASLIGLAAAQLRGFLPFAGESAPLVQLLQVPLVVCLLELWLVFGADRRGSDAWRWPMAGVLVSLGELASATLITPTAYAPGDWPGLVAVSLAAGGLAGWLVGRAETAGVFTGLRRRLRIEATGAENGAS